MKDFQFRIPGTILFKKGCSSDLNTYKDLNISGKVLLVTDHMLAKLGIADKIKTAIQDADTEVVLFDSVEPEPSVSTVRNLIELARKENVTSVVGLGGGSPMDVAKIAALVISSPQPIESLYGVGNAIGDRLPLILIPTTAGTGSEGTPVAVVTGDDGEKSPIVGPQFICDTVILDAELTLGLPPRVTAATGIDAMVHAIEAYTSAVRKNPVSDQLALQALKFLYGNIQTAVHHGDNYEAREKMLVGSMMAGLAFANASVGAVHALAYPLGTQFHLSHGESNALVFAEVMKFNLVTAFSHYAEISKVLIPEAKDLKDNEAAELLIKKISTLIPELGLKENLSDFGIEEKDLGLLVDGTLNQARLLSYNIRTMNHEDIYAVYKTLL